MGKVEIFGNVFGNWHKQKEVIKHLWYLSLCCISWRRWRLWARESICWRRCYRLLGCRCQGYCRRLWWSRPPSCRRRSWEKERWSLSSSRERWRTPGQSLWRLERFSVDISYLQTKSVIYINYLQSIKFIKISLPLIKIIGKCEVPI